MKRLLTSTAAAALLAAPAHANLNDTILEFCSSVLVMNVTENKSGAPGSEMARHAMRVTGQSAETYRQAWQLAKRSGNYMCREMY